MSYPVSRRPQPGDNTSSASATSSHQASIEELAQRAEVRWDPLKDFKYWLKVAENTRHLGQDYDYHGDIENAFVEYAKAATLILDKIPTHRDFHTRLDSAQRETLLTKGKGVLDRMGELKPTLIDRHNAWVEAETRGESAPRHQNAKLRPRDGSLTRRATVIGNDRDERQFWYPNASTAAQEWRRRRAEAQFQAQSAEQRSEQGSSHLMQEENKVSNWGGSDATSNNPNAQTGLISIPTPNLVTPQNSSSQSSSISFSEYDTVSEPPLLPLESPKRHLDEDAADIGSEGHSDEQLYKKIAELSIGSHRSSAPNLPSSFGGPSFPQITTTSVPPPTLSSIQYPQLMSQHQRSQGYTPSLQSMFLPSDDSISQRDFYQNILPRPSQPVHYQDYTQRSRAYMYGPREAPQSNYSNSSRLDKSNALLAPRPSSELHVRPPRSLPRSITPPPAPPVRPTLVEPRQVVAVASTGPRDLRLRRDLKTVVFPREVLPRFLSIASVDTAKNRETCGLLLGRAKGVRYVVTTLLIPKQHSTSDTCTMDEEELVLEFTESRQLITLGWIHTHPSQSCFMSSVDLHTHSGFQRMLPEAIAVVCAPKFTPNFGIFRLTDPPGLQTILNCDQKNAFHPHPELPIYTDADKGHVQMRDMALEIIDLR